MAIKEVMKYRKNLSAIKKVHEIIENE